MDRADRAAWLDQLACWNDPAEFRRLIDGCKEAASLFGTMTDHGFGFWRDAWIGSEVSDFLAAEKIRLLHPAPYPDFALIVDGRAPLFEATEAMGADRRRSYEFKQDLANMRCGKSFARHIPENEWLTPETAFKMLKSRSDIKAQKPYAPNSELVIYLNQTHFGNGEADIISIFPDATRSSGDVFQAVYVMWKSVVYPVW